MPQAWRAGWKAAGGKVDEPPRKVSIILTKTERGGRWLSFTVKGVTHKPKISRSRTQVTLGGEPTPRKKLKVGMACDVTYGGHKSEAKIVSCK